MNEKFTQAAGIIIAFTITIGGAIFFLMATAGQPIISEASIWAEGVAIICAIVVFVSTTFYLLRPEGSFENTNISKTDRFNKITVVLMCSTFFSFITWGFVRMFLS